MEASHLYLLSEDLASSPSGSSSAEKNFDNKAKPVSSSDSSDSENDDKIVETTVKKAAA